MPIIPGLGLGTDTPPPPRGPLAIRGQVFVRSGENEAFVQGLTPGTFAPVSGPVFFGLNVAGPSAPIFMTSAQATAALNVFTASLQGLVPASGGGTTNFLRADGTWAPATGSPGPTGATGPMGPQGERGESGRDGDPGPIGPTGSAGAPGATGATGAAGATGAQGIPGERGEPGSDGDLGPIGPIGPQGVIGPTGATGGAGTNGLQGFPGDVGEDGRDGDIGPIGPTGPQGIVGPTGATGSAGANGLQGFPGDIGEDGRDGDLGPIGPTGPQGIAGPTGATGSAGSNGIQGLQGFPGDIGEDGRDGDLGPIGPTGPQGIPGTPGATGATGATGSNGFGFPGDNGEEGRDGDLGPIGPTGPQGVPGATGATGGAGPTGPIGPQGVMGPEGPEGREGPEGPIGPVGPTGPAGANGAPGATGATGANGASGSTPPAAGLVLSATNQSLEIVTSTGADIDFEVSWNGLSGGVTTPASNAGSIITAATTANVVPAPGASAQNTIVECSITNVDTTFSQVITVQKNVGGTPRVLLNSINLAPSERIEFTSDRGWRVFDQAGRERNAASGAVPITIFTPGTVLGLSLTAGSNGPGTLLQGNDIGELLRIAHQFSDTVSGGTVANYSLPDGFTGATFNPPSALTVRGISSGTINAGRFILFVVHRSATFTVTLKHEDTGTGATQNRMNLPGNVDLVLAAGDSVILWHDPVLDRYVALYDGLSLTFSGADYPSGGSIGNLNAFTVRDGTNTRISSSNGGPSPANGATLAVDHRWTSDNLCLREDFQYSFAASQAINSGGTNITFTQSAWQLQSNANPGSFSNLGTSVADNPGVIRLTTGVVSGDFIVMTHGVGGSSSQAVLFGNRIRAFEWIITSQSASSNARLGFIDSIASTGPSNGVYFELLAATGVWRGRVVVSSVVYEVGSFTGGPSVVCRLRCEIPSIGSTPTFFANGTQLTTVTAGSAQAAPAVGLCFGAGFFAATNSARSLDIDYVEYESQALSR